MPVSFARAAGERPVALVHARVSAAEGRTKVTNRRHEAVQLTDLNLRLVPLLDGTRDRTSLTDALVQLALAGDLTVQKAVVQPDGGPGGTARRRWPRPSTPPSGSLARDALLAG